MNQKLIAPTWTCDVRDPTTTFWLRSGTIVICALHLRMHKAGVVVSIGPIAHAGGAIADSNKDKRFTIEKDNV